MSASGEDRAFFSIGVGYGLPRSEVEEEEVAGCQGLICLREHCTIQLGKKAGKAEREQIRHVLFALGIWF